MRWLRLSERTKERLAGLVTVAPEMARGASRPRVVSVSTPEPRLVDRFGISFVLIPAGTFQMGSDQMIGMTAP